jgi:hypothetical protein
VGWNGSVNVWNFPMKTNDAPIASPSPFPLGFWNYCTLDLNGPEAAQEWVDCGMTRPMTQTFRAGRDDPQRLRAVLDALAERGLQAIVCDDRATAWRVPGRAALDAYKRNFEAAVRDFGGHPATFGFYHGDEPEAPHFEALCEAIRFAREAAPHVTPFLNLLPKLPETLPRVGFSRWPEYLDTLCTQARLPLLSFAHYAQLDHYRSEEGIESWFDNLREYREAASRHGIPFWTTVLSAGHYDFRCPTEDDFRWQLHAAVAHGARGILWFFLYMREPHGNYRTPPIDEHGERTETFHWLSRVQRTFLKGQAPFLQRLRLRRVVHVGRAWGGHERFAGTDQVAAVETPIPHILTEWTDHAGRPWVSLVNNTPRDTGRVVLVLRDRGTRIIRAGWMGREIPIPARPVEGGVRFWLHTAPGQMELYRLDRDFGQPPDEKR